MNNFSQSHTVSTVPEIELSGTRFRVHFTCAEIYFEIHSVTQGHNFHIRRYAAAYHLTWHIFFIIKMSIYRVEL